MDYDWPGNVRELEHILEGAILLSKEEIIGENDLSAHLYTATHGVAPVSPPDTEEMGDLSLEDVEKRHIDLVLRKNDYNRSKTAEDLGISKKTLYLKIKRYSLLP